MKLVSLPMEKLVEMLLLQLEEGGVAPLTVTGNSMYPTFRHRRDTVTLVKGQPGKKDVILYKRDNGAYVLHRVVKAGAIYTCCGDNQWQPEPVRPDQVIAVVSGFVRKGKNYTVEHKGYRLWIWFWVGIFPVRRPILALRHGLGCLHRKIWRKQK